MQVLLEDIGKTNSYTESAEIHDGQQVNYQKIDGNNQDAFFKYLMREQNVGKDNVQAKSTKVDEVKLDTAKYNNHIIAPVNVDYA